MSRSFALAPGDYVQFMAELQSEGCDIVSVSFHGYEVTLPRSWPYVQSVFDAALGLGVERLGIVTNGMLLSRYVRELSHFRQAARSFSVIVSLDGADPETNDRHRGVDGAFQATVRNIQRVLEEDPQLAGHLMIASVLFKGQNGRSLANMPDLLLDLGIWTWGVEAELVGNETGGEGGSPAGLGTLGPAEANCEALIAQLHTLQCLAEAKGIRCHTGRCTLGRLQGIWVPELNMGEDLSQLKEALSFRFLPSGTVFFNSQAPSARALQTFRSDWRPDGRRARVLNLDG